MDTAERSDHLTPPPAREATSMEFEHRTAAPVLLSGRSMLLRSTSILPCLLCVLVVAPGQVQAQTPNPNLGGCDKNITDACLAVAKETEEACLEYATYGFNRVICQSWVSLAWAECIDTCADCEMIAVPLGRQCKFQLGPLGEGALIDSYCASTIHNFKNFRCPSVTYPLSLGGINGGDNLDPAFIAECESDEGMACQVECGSWYPCQCKVRRGMENLPDACDGTPYVTGTIEYNEVVALPERQYACETTPPQCIHHKEDPSKPGRNLPTKCAKYRKCPPDRCLIKRLICEAPHQCQEVRECDRELGRCFFQSKPLGSPCNDGINYTVDDYCDRGWCTGHTDYCIKYNVNCEPLNECTIGGNCLPSNGRCMYDKKPDGEMCDDKRPYTVEDRCHSGLCVGTFVDLCVDWGIQCKAPNSCFDPGVCDPKTGLCSDPVAKPGAEPCDDGDDSTRNDTCIDGICLGVIISENPVTFQTMGKGECSDRDGNRMASYVGDVKNEKECEAWCLEDAQCQGYAYGYPLCSLYGTVRERAPIHHGRPWAFSGPTFPAAVQIESAVMAFSGQKEMFCRRKGWTKDLEDPSSLLKDFTADTFFSFESLIIFFVAIVAVFLFPVCLVQTYKSCKKPEVDDVDEFEEEDDAYVPGNSSSQVAQAPAALEADGAEKAAALEGEASITTLGAVASDDADTLRQTGQSAEDGSGGDGTPSQPAVTDLNPADGPLPDEAAELPGATIEEAEEPQAPDDSRPATGTVDPPPGTPPQPR